MRDRERRRISWCLGVALLLGVGSPSEANDQSKDSRRGLLKLVRPARSGLLFRQRSGRRPRTRWQPSRLESALRWRPTTRSKDRRTTGLSAYPKYIGGFHSRYFDEYGLPPGDYGVWPRPW
ncbi:MAG: hypothetical protein CMJ59_14720 [Planctomycetaceae bacterium]|nr:hypothetical protein [Planctomycetaceae bacterium]